MTAPSRFNLVSIYQAHQPPPDAVRLAITVAEVLSPGFARGVQHRTNVRDVISRAVDEKFRSLCTLGSVDERNVELLVRHPATAATLRRQWLMHLVDHLDRNCCFKVSPTIQFRVGCEGEPFLHRAPDPSLEGPVEQAIEWCRRDDSDDTYA